MKKSILALSIVFVVGGCTTIQHADHVVVTDKYAHHPVQHSPVPVQMVVPESLVNQVVFPGYLPAAATLPAQPVYPASMPYAVPSVPVYQHSGYGLYDVHPYYH